MTRRGDFEAFTAAGGERVKNGQRVYRGRSFRRPPAELLQEIEDECLDLAGWGFVLWCRVRALRERAR